LIVQGYSPTSGESNDAQWSCTYVFGWELANRWQLDFANRYASSAAEEDHFNVWSPSAVLKIPVSRRWKTHIEYFGVMTEGREDETTQNFVSPGAHYLITPNHEIGARFGWGLNDDSPDFFVNAGVGWRF
jgi:hypothetical protein